MDLGGQIGCLGGAALDDRDVLGAVPAPHAGCGAGEPLLEELGGDPTVSRFAEHSLHEPVDVVRRNRVRRHDRAERRRGPHQPLAGEHVIRVPDGMQVDAPLDGGFPQRGEGGARGEGAGGDAVADRLGELGIQGHRAARIQDRHHVLML